ncbi:MAG: hypothetical protein H0W06_07450 [Chloroflexia bacterium]|nr:hypothetical protein [Chloroflexia bacterium]
MVLTSTSAGSTAAPGTRSDSTSFRAQNVDWLGSDAAGQLDVGFDALVPTAVPSPFGGEPAIQSSAGYYSLYWWIPGEPPTFLQISGTVGGALPAGSPYDLNIQLEINASVQGNPAIQDITPIYDNVWWQAGNVVYMVSSRNLTETDSLSLANALVPLTVSVPDEPDTDEGPVDVPVEEPEVNPEPEPALILPEVVEASEVATISVQGVESATLVADAGTFVDTGSATYENVGSWAVLWEAPAVTNDMAVGLALLDASDGSVLARGEIIVAGTPSVAATEPPANGGGIAEQDQGSEPLAEDVGSTEADETTVESVVEPGPSDTGDGEEPSVTDGTGGAAVQSDSDTPPPTDGTDGPIPPLFGSDGTGGVNQVVIPTNQQEDE